MRCRSVLFGWGGGGRRREVEDLAGRDTVESVKVTLSEINDVEVVSDTSPIAVRRRKKCEKEEAGSARARREGREKVSSIGSSFCQRWMRM